MIDPKDPDAPHDRVPALPRGHRVMTKRYAKKREPLCAAQWTGEMTPDVAELIGERKTHVDGDRQLTLGNGWFAKAGDWICSTSGEDLSVIGDEVFRKIYEEVDEAGRAMLPTDDEHEAAGVEFVRELDVILSAGLRLSREDHPAIFRDRDRLVRTMRGLLEDHAYTAARRERHRVSGDEHPLNQAIDRMIDRDRVSEADVLLAKVRDQCVSFPFADLHTAIEVHRANCHLQTGCPVLAAMERVAAEQSANSALRACPGCGRRFAMLYICTRCGRCDAQDLPRDADRAACCAGDDKCAEIDWRGEPRAGKELSL